MLFDDLVQTSCPIDLSTMEPDELSQLKLKLRNEVCSYFACRNAAMTATEIEKLLRPVVVHARQLQKDPSSLNAAERLDDALTRTRLALVERWPSELNSLEICLTEWFRLYPQRTSKKCDRDPPAESCPSLSAEDRAALSRLAEKKGSRGYSKISRDVAIAARELTRDLPAEPTPDRAWALPEKARALCQQLAKERPPRSHIPRQQVHRASQPNWPYDIGTGRELRDFEMKLAQWVLHQEVRPETEDLEIVRRLAAMDPRTGLPGPVGERYGREMRGDGDGALAIFLAAVVPIWERLTGRNAYVAVVRSDGCEEHRSPLHPWLCEIAEYGRVPAPSVGQVDHIIRAIKNRK
ncbi:MAG: hypothetical protein H6843_05110 [Rhodospirillaceae bacterium]|nr:hypothetical protein [Rhodospirillaceae bacterium]